MVFSNQWDTSPLMNRFTSRKTQLKLSFDHQMIQMGEGIITSFIDQ